MKRTRTLPEATSVADAWGLPSSSCWACGSDGEMERSHIVDHARNGLDDVQNLALLCRPCHTVMPSHDDLTEGRERG